MKRVLIIATLDTKGEVALYLRRAVRKRGKEAIVLDCGMAGDPVGPDPEISREEIALAAHASYCEVTAMSREDAEETMARGVAKTVRALFDRGGFDGVLAVGGSDGTILATAGMRELPLGVPKLVVSAMACGEVRFGEYVGTKDITIMPSGVDIMGVSPITRTIYDNAVGAICGMVDREQGPRDAGDNQVAVTMFGQTTPCVMFGKGLLEAADYQLVAFHPNGVGGVLMEELIREDNFRAVWDLTTQELTRYVVTGGPPEIADRLSPAGPGVPRAVVPGCMDFIWGSPDRTDLFSHRRCHRFNRSVVLGKVTPEEMRTAAELLADRANKLPGDVVVLLPLRGISKYDRQGAELYDPDLDELLFATLRGTLGGNVKVVEVDAHINDRPFAEACVAALLESVSAPKTA